MSQACPGHILPHDRFVKVIPIRVDGDDLPHLPRAWLMLHVVLALNGVADVVELFEIDQPLQPVPPGETCDTSAAVFVDTANEITGHADIQNAVRTIGQNVNPATLSCGNSARRGWPGQARP